MIICPSRLRLIRESEKYNEGVNTTHTRDFIACTGELGKSKTVSGNPRGVAKTALRYYQQRSCGRCYIPGCNSFFLVLILLVPLHQYFNRNVLLCLQVLSISFLWFRQLLFFSFSLFKICRAHFDFPFLKSVHYTKLWVERCENEVCVTLYQAQF